MVACQTLTDAEVPPDTHETVSVLVQPSSSTTGELSDQTVSGSIVVSIPAEGWMRSVSAFLDNALLGTLESAPFDFVVDTTALEDGTHSLRIEARMANGRLRVSQTVEFTVLNDGDPGGEEAPLDDIDDADDLAPPVDDPPGDEGDDPHDRPAPSDPPPSDRGFGLRGDPNFSAANLSPEQRVLYDMLWDELRDPTKHKALRSQALSDDVYRYGRTFGGHLRNVLTVFRMTGDLALLDYVDELTELMRSKLADGWRDTADGTDGTRDGYLNWVYRYSATPSHQGKDTRVIDDMQAHAVVAMFAWAYEANRDLSSPSGTNYGQRADFWKDYLVNHFEAKWRERYGRPTGFPFISRTQTTVYYNWTAWHYYMWRLTGVQGYGDQAVAMARATSDELRLVSTSSGTTYVWGSGLINLGDSQTRIQPTNYSSTVYALNVDLHFEQFDVFASEERLHRMARTFSHFVLDTSDPIRNGFAPDLGGGSPQAGLTSDPDAKRRTIDWYRVSQIPLIATWDTTLRLPTLNSAAKSSIASNRDSTAITVGLIVDSVVRPTSASSSSMTTAAAGGAW